MQGKPRPYGIVHTVGDSSALPQNDRAVYRLLLEERLRAAVVRCQILTNPSQIHLRSAGTYRITDISHCETIYRIYISLLPEAEIIMVQNYDRITEKIT